MRAKKEKAIVMGVCHVFEPACTTLLSLKGKISESHDLIVYHYDLKELELAFLRTFFKCRDFEYTMNLKKADEIYTHMAFSIFECLDLLRAYKQVLWLDTDIIVCNNIDGLFENGSGIGAYFHRPNMYFKFVDERIPARPRGFTKKTPFFNSGVVLFNDDVKNPSKIRKWCYKYVSKYHKKFTGADQGVLNLAVYKFRVPATNIGSKYNYLTFQKEMYPLNEVNPAIIHYAQNPKPWIDGAEKIYGKELMEIWNEKNSEFKALVQDFRE